MLVSRFDKQHPLRSLAQRIGAWCHLRQSIFKEVNKKNSERFWPLSLRRRLVEEPGALLIGNMSFCAFHLALMDKAGNR